MPDFHIATVEDAYAYYVLVLGISEEIFWHADVAFLREVAANKTAYDSWLQTEREVMRLEAEKRHGKRKKRG